MTGDRRRIKEALADIIQNALEATQGGGVLRIRAGVREEAPAGFNISIQDEGVGIPREEVRKVFDPFYTTKPQGIGLGMAIAHNTIASHGGTIDIDSAEGKGTAITVALPREA
jgi:signal transduction histidine kinase